MLRDKGNRYGMLVKETWLLLLYCEQYQLRVASVGVIHETQKL